MPGMSSIKVISSSSKDRGKAISKISINWMDALLILIYSTYVIIRYLYGNFF